MPGTPRADGLPSAGWRQLLLWFLGRRRRYRVSGSSMVPLLEDADEVLVDPRSPMAPGDVVVARHPFRRSAHLVKRLDSYDHLGRARLLGTRPGASTDSRSLGNLAPDLLRGRVSCALRRRRTRLRAGAEPSGR